MTDIILHHYETSPYSEKVRLGLGLKGLAWETVEIPVIMPKSDLTALTGGYRKTPVLQIGANYCDSQLIMRELERRHPTPNFFIPPATARPMRLPVGREDNVQPGCQHRVREETRHVARRIPRRSGQILRPKYRSGRALHRFLGDRHDFAGGVPHLFPGIGELASEEFSLNAHGLLQVGRMDQLPRVLEDRFHVLLGKRQSMFRDFSPARDRFYRLACSVEEHAECPFRLLNDLFCQFA
jgi:hypothetical protein